MIIFARSRSTNQILVSMNCKNIIVLFVFSLLCISQANAQALLGVKKSSFVDKSEKSVNAYSKITEALTMYEQAPNSTDKCLALLLQAYQYKKTNAVLNYNIGVCYLNSDSKIKASKYLLEAYDLKPTVSKDICYQIGRSHQYQYEFLKALKMFQKNIEILVNSKKANKNQVLIEICEKSIDECKSGLNLQALDRKQTVYPLDNTVNSKYNDLNPIEKGSTFYFSSQREASAKGKLLEKVYSVSTDQNQGVKKENIPFRTYSNLALVAFSDDEFIFYSGLNGGGDFIPAEYKNGKWISKGSLPTINSASSREASACIAGDEFYFVSDRQGTLGECDIYYCSKEKNGRWSKAKNIGAEINTVFDEADVFVTPDGKEMYFNSKGHNSMGGYDIFKCVRSSDGKWSKPVNMGIPVNSPFNDIQYFKSAKGAEYFSSERNGGAGGFDIYSIGKVVEKEIVKAKPQAPKTSASPAEQAPVKKANKEILPELIYRVQILACKKEASVEELYKIYNGKEVIEQQFLEEWHKYAIGKFKTYREAEAFKNACGIEGAFIVLFKNGKPLKVKR